MFPPLYAFMVWAESPISGTSTNPARSLGPAVVSGQWPGFWIYRVGPLIGMLAAIIACSFLAKKISVAKLYYFDSDPSSGVLQDGPPFLSRRTRYGALARTSKT